MDLCSQRIFQSSQGQRGSGDDSGCRRQSGNLRVGEYLEMGRERGCGGWGHGIGLTRDGAVWGVERQGGRGPC